MGGVGGDVPNDVAVVEQGVAELTIHIAGGLARGDWLGSVEQ